MDEGNVGQPNVMGEGGVILVFWKGAECVRDVFFGVLDGNEK